MTLAETLTDAVRRGYTVTLDRVDEIIVGSTVRVTVSRLDGDEILHAAAVCPTRIPLDASLMNLVPALVQHVEIRLHTRQEPLP